MSEIPLQASTITVDPDKSPCPICQNPIGNEVVEKAGLSIDDLSTIHTLLHENILMQIIDIGKMAAKYFKPETLTTEVQVHDSLRFLSEKASELMDRQRALTNEIAGASEEKRIRITEEALKRQQEINTRFQDEIRKLEEDHARGIENMTSMLQQIQQRINGVGIGDVRQATVIRDLKSSCPTDEFSDEKARKAGTDIIAKVIEKSNEVGKIVISVKEVEKWSGDFVDQIRKNKIEEQTEWAILVTKAFPSSALNERLYFDSINGILVVKAEYAGAAYAGLRHCVVYKHQAQNWFKSHQESSGMHQIVTVLQNWVNGDELKKILGTIDEAHLAATQADDVLQKLQAYNDKQLKTTRELADKVRRSLQNCSSMLTELKERLPLND